MKPFSSLFTFFLLFLNILLCAKSDNAVPFHVGVILDSSSSTGQLANTCISMGISDFYNKFDTYKTRLVLHKKDSQGDPLQALAQAVDLLQNDKVQAIIGPQTTNEAEFVANLGVKAEVPIISFSATSPSISHATTSFFVRLANNDNSQVKHITSLVQEFQWREVVLVYEDSTYGNGIVANLVSAFDEIHTRVPYRSVVSPSATENEITIELYKLMTMSNRVFVVHMSSSLAYRFFSKLNELGMMSKGYAWIITDGMTNALSSITPPIISSMQGVIGIRPYLPPSKKLSDFFTKGRNLFLEGKQSIKINDLNRNCLWAYDAVWALAISAEKLGIEGSDYNTKKNSLNLSNLTSIVVSQTGSKLLNILLDTKFDGLSGPVSLKNGERNPLTYEIINIIGENIKVLDNSKALAPVWPGGSVEIPRGWVNSGNSKRLRIGVPIRTGFQELVKVERDNRTNAYQITGFCIEVFRYAIELLPYDVSYEFVPFLNADGTSSGDYNALIYQVYLQKLDGVVGDVTITSNRSLYVDFTLPFIEGGIAMVVPTCNPHSFWIFLQPLTTRLWLVILGFFIATGVIIWAIERRENINFKGPVLQQLENIFSLSVSSLVFAPGESLRRCYSKFVVIMWLFAAFVITSSYTASLSSLLTTSRLLQLPKNGLIGYRPPSFGTKLLSNLNFKDTQTKPYKSENDYANAMKKGSSNGGVSAIVDEIPYIKLFLAKYSDGYAMINPTHDTSGFGFVFPKRSRIVPDLSGAIAKLRESGRLQMLQEVWFGYKKQGIVSDDTQHDNSILSPSSFRGLFLILGITLILAFAISYIFSKYVPCINKEPEEGEDNSVVVDELILPFDNISMTLVISDSSSDDNISIEGEGIGVVSPQNHVTDTDHHLPLPKINLVQDYLRSIDQLRDSGQLEIIRKSWVGPEKRFISEDSPVENNVFDLISTVFMAFF